MFIAFFAFLKKVFGKKLILELLFGFLMNLYYSSFAGFFFHGSVDLQPFLHKISAYRRLVDLQRSRIPFSVLTRLGSYNNMLIESVNVPDEPAMMNGLSCTVSMREVLVANVATAKVSARQWSTHVGTHRGEVQPKGKPKTVLKSVEDWYKTGGWFRG